MNTQKTIMTFVLDESGSMSPARKSTIDGFNEFLDSQRDHSLGECRVSLEKFNTSGLDAPEITFLYEDQHIDDVKPLTVHDYQPAGMTPLYDAIAQAISATEAKYKTEKDVIEAMLGRESDLAMPLIIIIIMTDGQENKSKNTTRQAILDMISEKKQAGWQFVFIGEGSDPDTWKQGVNMGMATARYAYATTGRAMHGLADATRNFRTNYFSAIKDFQASTGDESLTEDERKLKTSAVIGRIKSMRADYFEGKEEL